MPDWAEEPGTDRGVSCWEDGGDSTCLLPDGHDGPHEFTLDSDIWVTFIEDREPQPGDGPDYFADHAAWRERNR